MEPPREPINTFYKKPVNTLLRSDTTGSKTNDHILILAKRKFHCDLSFGRLNLSKNTLSFDIFVSLNVEMN